MGWDATNYFDATLDAAKEVLQEINDLYSDQIPMHDMLLRIARPLAAELDEGDWDTHRESDFWDELKWDLWPDEAEEEKADLEYDAFDD